MLSHAIGSKESAVFIIVLSVPVTSFWSLLTFYFCNVWHTNWFSSVVSVKEISPICVNVLPRELSLDAQDTKLDGKTSLLK